MVTLPSVLGTIQFTICRQHLPYRPDIGDVLSPTDEVCRGGLGSPHQYEYREEAYYQGFKNLKRALSGQEGMPDLEVRSYLYIIRYIA